MQAWGGLWRADHNTQYLVTFFNAKTHVLLRWVSSCVVQLACTQLNTSSHNESAHTPRRMHAGCLTKPYERDNTRCLSPHTGDTRAREWILYSVSERERDFDCSQIDFLCFLVAFSSFESSTYQLHSDTTSSWQLHFISFAGFCLTLISYTTNCQWPFMWGFSFSSEYWLNF